MPSPALCAPRRRKCAATTRETILESARARFLAESYDAVGLRDIARDAGVDVALVSRYFGSKEELFRLVLKGGEERAFELPADAADLPAFFLAMIAQGGDAQCGYQRGKLMIMLRSASSPAATEVIRTSFGQEVLAPLAAVIGGPHAESKAALLLALLMGVNFQRTVIPTSPLAEDEQAHFHAQLRHLFETVLGD